MMLEDVARAYGMTADYYDNIGCKVYELSQAKEAPDNPDELLVPVRDCLNNNALVGYARMRKVG